ncbi:dipeptide/oligopeptide/nickel ABC transporter ATP-binding protein [Neoroseomonas lacus]|uniref:Dipeptide/oligopeptide/nickel ABC transporter ATP-binding protein n=2 Tax=Neoroseomonas lacus TaxID=287609 RepID=A0A917KZU1_9PROT|nr:dipeptide/oligopeptide/nickel ABC transporter ATP-binding protein [Neoroseomonas lacus]
MLDSTGARSHAVMMSGTPALEVNDLRTEFRIAGTWHAAVRGVSFTLARDETLALVGESGCGKSVTALSIMGLVQPPQGRVAGGQIRLDGRDVAGLPEKQWEKLRGDRIGMVFQEPMTSLNPVMTVGDQVAEALVIHKGLSRSAALERARALFDEVKIPSAAARLGEYPHQFSGGMRQRVMIAMALACEPAVLLADEPTTALDVTIQAQVLGLLADLKSRHGMAVLFITHNLGVVAQIADRVAVMYAGQIVEEGPVAAIFARPAHPYTRALFAAIPRLDQPEQALAAIPGRVPSLDAMPIGCAFAARCEERRAGCEAPQVLAHVGKAHRARCHVATVATAFEAEDTAIHDIR